MLFKTDSIFLLSCGQECKVHFALCHQQVFIGQAECVIPDWTLGLYCLLPRRADGGDWVVALWQCSLIFPSDSMVTRCPLVGGDVDGLCALKCHASGWVALLKSLDPSELSFPVCNLG